MRKSNCIITLCNVTIEVCVSGTNREPETERTGRALLEADCYLRPRPPWVQGDSLSDFQPCRKAKMPQSNKWHLGHNLSARRRSRTPMQSFSALSFNPFFVSKILLFNFVTLRYSWQGFAVSGGNQ